MLLCACLPQGQEEIVTFLLKFFLVFSLTFSFTVHMGLSFYTVGSMVDSFDFMCRNHMNCDLVLWIVLIDAVLFTEIYSSILTIILSKHYTTTLKKNHTHTHTRTKNKQTKKKQIALCIRSLFLDFLLCHQTICLFLPKKDVLFIIGDWNAKVGS